MDLHAPPSLLILGGGAVVMECYVPALVRLGWQDRVAIADKSDRAIAAIRNRCPSVRLCIGDFVDILQDRGVLSGFDGVVVALPNSLHEQAVLLAMAAGLDVLCEKPLANNVDTCMRLAAGAEQSGRRLVVAMVRRFVPSVIVIRDAIRDGLLGEVQEVDIEHGGSFHWPSESGSYFRKENGGLFLNMGIHYLDLIEDWLGPLTPVEYRDDAEGGVEANCKIMLRSGGGARVCVRLSYTHQLSNRIFVRGTRAEITVDVDGFASANWRSYRANLSADLQSTRPFSLNTLPPDFISAFAEQFVRFADVAAQRGEPPVSAARAVSTQRIIDWGYLHRQPLRGKATERPVRARPSLSAGRTVVTGGSGFLGVCLLERLTELGFNNIVVPVRSYQSGANAARFPVSRLLTNLLDRDSVRNAVAGAKYVFHLAYGASGTDASRVTLEGTKNVVDAAVEAGVETLVVVSTATVFGHPKTDRPVDETFPYRPALAEYGRSKAAAEKYALRVARFAERTRIVVINPTGIYGPNSKLLVEFPARAAMAGQFAWIEEGVGKFNYTFVENVVDALLLAADCRAAHGQNFIISDGVCTFREFYTRLLGPVAETLPSYSRSQLLEHERRTRPTWHDLLRGVMNDEVMRAVNGIPVLNKPKKFIEKRLPKVYTRMQAERQALRHNKDVPAAKPSVDDCSPAPWLADIFGPIRIEYSSAKARRILGWDPLVPLDTGLSASLNWLGAIGIVRDVNGGSSLLHPEALSPECQCEKN